MRAAQDWPPFRAWRGLRRKRAVRESRGSWRCAAAAKARRIAELNPAAVVIGSDQVAELDGTAIGKPGSHDIAAQQLHRCSGRIVNFHTAVCVVDGVRALSHQFVDLTRVHFRVLRADEIDRYLRAEQPYDCAGAFKCEGLGTALFTAIENSDPSALIGLPLIGWRAPALSASRFPEAAKKRPPAVRSCP